MIIVKKECICNDEEVILMALFGRFGHRGPYRKGEIKIRYTKFLMVMEIIGIVMLLISLFRQKVFIETEALNKQFKK